MILCEDWSILGLTVSPPNDPPEKKLVSWWNGWHEGLHLKERYRYRLEVDRWDFSPRKVT